MAEYCRSNVSNVLSVVKENRLFYHAEKKLENDAAEKAKGPCVLKQEAWLSSYH